MQQLAMAFRRLRTEAADAGMTTVEYAVGTLAAAAMAGALLVILTSKTVQDALIGVITRALK
ncbi:hypothetical protein GCM10010168_67120 [Actinoplanes ianthinogenes]|uniref:DUF4244 domain-containing protein n=2 Tax=Actinoplanes ianthinogenes TaxID=122358 RepID=A0ABN6CHQ8_9ACTN|nr:hypothetical protein Aiant_45660 [Actinoplanes ianthinogenes]GGR39137.1 hypothetical protein GCM10010168_67120 [Actinoplanes ianthinogenes]